MAQRYATIGTKLEVGNGDGPPETFTQIAEVKDFNPADVNVETQDITSHSSPNAWAELLPTILKAGAVDFEINYDPTEATHKNAANGLLALMKNRTLKNWKVILTDQAQSAILFAGYVVEFKPEAKVKGNLTAKLKIAITGAVTLP